MAAHVRSRAAVAAWLCGTGSGALLGAARALSSALGGRQLADRQLHHACQLFPYLAAPAAPPVPQTARVDDAEVAAPSQARGIDSVTIRAWHELSPGAVGRCAVSR